MLEDEVLKYTNQLEYSEYYEDKMNALENLEKIGKNDILLIGIYSMVAIIKSIKSTGEYKIQSRLLLKVIKSYQKNEFLDIMIKDEESVIILVEYKKYLSDVLLHITKTKGFEVFNILQKNNKLSLIFVDFEQTLNYFKYFINDNNKELFCHEGVFEMILEIVNEDNSLYCIEIVSKLLTDCMFNQNYYVELKWLEKFCKFKPNEIFIAILDKKNKYFVKNQRMFCKPEFINLKNYKLVEVLIYNNIKNFIIIEDLGFDLYKLCNDALSYNQLCLIEEALKYKEIDLMKLNTESNSFFYVLSLVYMQQSKPVIDYLYKQDLINEYLYNMFKIEEMKENERFGFIIFLVLLAGEVLFPQNILIIIKEFVCNSNNDPVLQNFLFLIIFEKYKNNETFDYSEEFYIEKLLNLRYFLCKTDNLLTNKLKELFINKIQDKTLFFYYKSFKEEYLEEKERLVKERSDKERLECKRLERNKNVLPVKDEEPIKNIDSTLKQKQVDDLESSNSAYNSLNTYKERFTGFINKMKYDKNKKDDNGDEKKDFYEL